MEKPKTYSSEDLKQRAGELVLHTCAAAANGYNSVQELLLDYNRARMLLAAAITKIDSDAEYIKRIETLTDKLLGMKHDL